VTSLRISEGEYPNLSDLSKLNSFIYFLFDRRLSREIGSGRGENDIRN
jgi:hypothetical protein